MVFKDDNICHQRHLHPSIYKKIIKTRDLIGKNVDPEEFRNRGGLDLKTFKALKQRIQDEEQNIEKRKGKFIAKYGSIKATPITVGPCTKKKPVVGTRNALVLLTEFKDIKHSYKPYDFQQLLFTKGSNLSMRDYYLEASWNQLDIKGKVNDQWFSAEGKLADYVDQIPVKGHYPRAQKLVEETIIQAKKSGQINFKPFARDSKIDILMVVYAGKGLDTNLNIKNIRPHQDRLTEPLEVQGGIWADKYCLISELPFDDLGCYCHEVAHLLGLPDLYKEGYSPVVGSWCLMAIGDHNNNGRTPAHPSAWCKLHLGWREPKLIKEIPGIHEIPVVMDADGEIYKVEVQGSNGGEYFLLENRQQKGFDRNLPGSGLLIWHVDENRCVHYAPNSDPEHFFLTLKQSDGKYELERDMTVLTGGEEVVMKELTGDEGDAYPGITVNRDFSEKSIPNSDSHSGAKSLVSVTSISDSGDIMEAQIGVQHQSSTVNSLIIPPAQSTEPTASKTSKIKLENLIALMTRLKDEDPYDEGYEACRLDVIETLMEEQGLYSYQKGYKRGYRHGYKKAWEKFSKNELIL